MSSDRDLKMGRALASIPLPELADDFYSRLARDLDEARGPRTRRRRRPRVLRLGIAAAAVAVAAALVAFVVLPVTRGTDTATAGDMLASMNAAAGDVDVVRLTIVEERKGAGAPTVEELTLSASGDVRFTSVRQHIDARRVTVMTHLLETYDEQRHEMRRRGRTTPVGTPPPTGDPEAPSTEPAVPVDGATAPAGSADVPTGAVTVQPTPYPAGGSEPAPSQGQSGGLIIERPSWGTDVFSTFLYANFQALANSLRSRLAEADPDASVTETIYLGRPAWHAELGERLPSSDSRSPDGVSVVWSVTVDKETGLLVASDLDAGSHASELPGLARSFRVTRLVTDPALPAGWQRIVPSPRENVSVFDRGTRFGTPEEVAKRAWPTIVLIPKAVPSGYRLTDIATRDLEGMGRSPSDQSELVHLSRGEPSRTLWKRTRIDASRQQVMVRFRRGFASFVVAIRPLVKGARSLGDLRGGPGEEVTLSAGYLKGTRARTRISPFFGGGPTLVVVSDRSRITITGDLTRRELIAAAESFVAYGDAEKPLPKGSGE